MTYEAETVAADAEASPAVAGVLAQFRDAGALVTAAAAVRKAGYRRWDCFSPFPVHGIDAAMGIRPTLLPWLVLGAGITGGAVALLMQWWMNAVDYPFLISGKPFFSLPANIPIIFELIVLFAALTAFVGTMALNRLPQFAHPVLGGQGFRRVTTDGLFIGVEACDPQFDAAVVTALLHSLGAVSVSPYHEAAGGKCIPAALIWALAILVSVALVPPLWVARARSVKSETPRIELIPDMDFQPKYKPLASSPLFADGSAARPPVPHTIARGEWEKDDHLYRGKQGDKWVTTFPIPVNDANMQRGREQFEIFCAACHGLAGGGDGVVSKRALRRDDRNWGIPPALTEDRLRDQPVGQLFNTMSNGYQKMPSYAGQIPVEDRWKILLYVRALQRSRHATLDDIPEEERDRVK